MEPTSATPDTTPKAGEPLVDYICKQRQNAGTILAIFAVVLLALTAFLGIKAFRASGEPEKPADKPLSSALRDPERLDPSKPESIAEDSKRWDYIVGGVGSLLAFLGVGTLAAYLLVSPIPPEPGRQRTEARIAILALGKVLGVTAILAGLVFFYLWSDSLTNWLDKGEPKEARWVLIPLMMIVAGAGLIFLAIQPSRAEERENAAIRRTVYGANFVLTILLLTVGFVVLNVLFSLKVPNKLDTTATGFYSISDNTRNLLTRLNEPVMAYAVALDTDRYSNDIRQLLLAAQEGSEGKFHVKFISDVSNKIEMNTLAQKYPNLLRALSERSILPGAVILATGPDENRHAVIPAGDFLSTEGRQEVFQGEARLFKEIAFLADSQSRAIVYFTQGNGELDIGGVQGSPPERSAARLKAYLESNYLDVRPLTLPPENPTVPDDATVVIVADPQRLVPEAAVGALRKYMTNPARKGKLIVLASAMPGPDRKMIKTGLEPLLGEINVKLGEKFIYNLPTQQLPAVESVLGAFSKSAQANPILLSIIKVTPAFVFRNPRQVEPVTTNPALQATDLLLSDGATWLEDEAITDFRPILDSFRESRRNIQARGVSDVERPLAVTVSERTPGPGAASATARAAVFGGSAPFADDAARQGRRPVSFDLLGVTIDWLRDKPSIAAAGIESKKYTEYQFPQPAKVNSMRVLYLPLGLAFLTVLGLGAGVWVIRRR